MEVPAVVLIKLRQMMQNTFTWRGMGIFREIYTGLNLMGSLAYIDAEYTKAAVKSGVTNQGNTVYGIPDTLPLRSA